MRAGPEDYAQLIIYVLLYYEYDIMSCAPRAARPELRAGPEYYVSIRMLTYANVC